ncbi:MAG: 1,4-dihydroxy-2-naphthoate octaprenyltransferase [Candidatus Roseilinea sp.]|nr:MAG: 1,4-dihydroxy-2-naphthoate octaprenyltransferase [Candidatus Roseilinea sp.]
MNAVSALRPSAWLLAARLRTLPASISPVIVGTALSLREGKFDLPIFVATLAAAMLLQVGANYANDVFDYLKGADRARRGPLRVTQSGLLTPRQMLVGTAVVFGLAALIGIYLVLAGGWPILLIGALAIICALAYTAGPFPLAYRGLGDLFAFVFFGVIAVMGTYFLQSGRFTLVSFIASLPNALFATAIIVVNNLRDMDTDREAGKYTLAVRIGDRATRLEYTLMLAGAYLIPLILRVGGAIQEWAWLLPWVSAPVALMLVRDLWRAPRSPALNPILARTAQLNLLFSILFAVGLIVVGD